MQNSQMILGLFFLFFGCLQIVSEFLIKNKKNKNTGIYLQIFAFFFSCAVVVFLGVHKIESYFQVYFLLSGAMVQWLRLWTKEESSLEERLLILSLSGVLVLATNSVQWVEFVFLILLWFLGFSLFSFGRRGILNSVRSEASQRVLRISFFIGIFFVLLLAQTQKQGWGGDWSFHTQSQELTLSVFFLFWSILGFFMKVFPLNLVHASLFRRWDSTTNFFWFASLIGIGFLIITKTSMMQNWDQTSVFAGEKGKYWLQGLGLWTAVFSTLQIFSKKDFPTKVAQLLLAQTGWIWASLSLPWNSVLPILLAQLPFELLGLAGFLLCFEYVQFSTKRGGMERVLFLIFAMSVIGLPPFPKFFAQFAVLNLFLEQGQFEFAAVFLAVLVLGGIGVARMTMHWAQFGTQKKHVHIGSEMKIPGKAVVFLGIPFLIYLFFPEVLLKITKLAIEQTS